MLLKRINDFQDFLIKLFVFLMLICMSCLYILDINSLSLISLENIFSHSVGCLFVLSMISFAVQKLLSLIRPHLFIFTFISFALGDKSEKVLLRFVSKSIQPMFSSRSFMVLGLTFRSLIHFEFIFGYSVRNCSHFILLQIAIHFSQHHLLNFSSVLEKHI